MAKTKAELKTIFVTGAKPTQADFHDLIEGVQGEQGPQGLQGPKGDTGAKGETGAQGVKGDTGAIGPAGAKGDKGDTGATGAKGADGAKGANGLSITAIALTTDVDGKVTGGTAILSDASTVAITVTTA